MIDTLREIEFPTQVSDTELAEVLPAARCCTLHPAPITLHPAPCTLHPHGPRLRVFSFETNRFSNAVKRPPIPSQVSDEELAEVLPAARECLASRQLNLIESAVTLTAQGLFMRGLLVSGLGRRLAMDRAAVGRIRLRLAVERASVGNG